MSLFVNYVNTCNCCGIAQRGAYQEAGPPLLLVYDEPLFLTAIHAPRDGEAVAFYRFAGAHLCANCAIAEQEARRKTIATMTRREKVDRTEENVRAHVQSVRSMDLPS